MVKLLSFFICNSEETQNWTEGYTMMSAYCHLHFENTKAVDVSLLSVDHSEPLEGFQYQRKL